MKKSAVYLIQHIILDANKSSGKPNLIEGCPHSFDIGFCINNLFKDGFDSDINECVNEAFNTFKFHQFINHEEELRNLIPTYFEN